MGYPGRTHTIGGGATPTEAGSHVGRLEDNPGMRDYPAHWGPRLK